MGRSLLAISDLKKNDINGIIRRAGELKGLKKQGENPKSLESMSVGLLFEKQSTRTRLSFEAGLFDLGAQTVYMNPVGYPAWKRGNHSRHGESRLILPRRDNNKNLRAEQASGIRAQLGCSRDKRSYRS